MAHPEHNTASNMIPSPTHRSYEELVRRGAVAHTLARGDLYETDLNEMEPLQTVQTSGGRMGLLGVMSLSNDHVRLEMWGALDDTGRADPNEIAVTAEGFDPQDLFDKQPGQGYLMLNPGQGFGIGKYNPEFGSLFGGTTPREVSRVHGAMLVTEDGTLKVEHQSGSYANSTLLTAPTESQPVSEDLETTQPRRAVVAAGGAAVQEAVEKPAEPASTPKLELPEDSAEVLGKLYAELQQLEASGQGFYPFKQLAGRILDETAHTDRADLGVLEALVAAGAMYTHENALAVTQVLDRIQQDFKTLDAESMQWFRQIMGNLSFIEGAQEDVVRAYNNSVTDMINSRVFPEKESLKVAFLAFATGLNMRDIEFGGDYLQALQNRIEA